MTAPQKPDTCEHRRVTTYRSDDGTIRIWSCDDCKLRFYPACTTCVDVGHRGVKHPETWGSR